MWTVLDTVRGRRTRHKKEEGASAFTPSSLKVLALRGLALNTEPPQGLGISPNRLSLSGTALKGVHVIREGLRVRGALATSTRKPEGTPSALMGLACSERTQEYSVTAVREWNPFWLGVSALTTLKGYKTLRKFKEKFRFNFWTFTTKNTRLHPSNPPIEPNHRVWLIPGGIW